VDAANEGVVSAQAQRAQALASLQDAQSAPEQIKASTANAHNLAAKVLQAKAAVTAAQVNFDRTEIKAPQSGIVSDKNIEPGQQVGPGQQLMSIIPDEVPWVIANFKETQIGRMRPGDHAQIQVDALGGKTFTGTINSIARGTGATFALLPPENATGNFTKVVQRVPVKIVLDPGQPDLNLLRSGLSVVATVTLGD
jgi:membrane fusion protein (multidrug efflux system)